MEGSARTQQALTLLRAPQITYLEQVVLQTDLSHISGRRVSDGNPTDVANVVELVGTMCTLSGAAADSAADSAADANPSSA